MATNVFKYVLLSLIAFPLFLSYSCTPSIEKRIAKYREAAKDAPPKNSDTTLVQLPGLLLFKETPSLHNATSFDIVCLDKSGVVTNTLEEIEKCECRLYQKEAARIKRIRVLWEAQPINQQIWQRTFFDEAGKPTKKDKLKTTIPFRHIMIHTENTWGEHSNAVIITAYFEMIILKGTTSRI